MTAELKVFQLTISTFREGSTLQSSYPHLRDIQSDSGFFRRYRQVSTALSQVRAQPFNYLLSW